MKNLGKRLVATVAATAMTFGGLGASALLPLDKKGPIKYFDNAGYHAASGEQCGYIRKNPTDYTPLETNADGFKILTREEFDYLKSFYDKEKAAYDSEKGKDPNREDVDFDKLRIKFESDGFEEWTPNQEIDIPMSATGQAFYREFRVKDGWYIPENWTMEYEYHDELVDSFSGIFYGNLLELFIYAKPINDKTLAIFGIVPPYKHIKDFFRGTRENDRAVVTFGALKQGTNTATYPTDLKKYTSWFIGVDGVKRIETYYLDAQGNMVDENGNPISEPIKTTEPVAQIPSDWAKPEVESARTNQLIPQDLDSSYTKAATRLDFAKMVTALLMNKKAMDVAGLLAAAPNAPQTFTDSADDAVKVAAAYGITTGMGDGTFAPSMYISREQAATMMGRLAKVLGMTYGTAMSFDDMGDMSGWAVESILLISSLEDKNGKRVMGGTSVGIFLPKGTYTREQAFCSFYRLFNI